MKGTIFSIQRSSLVDGPGIRTTVFFKGCNLRCRWCHSPESRAMYPQMLVYTTRCVRCGSCREICPASPEGCGLCGRCVACCPHEARQICGKKYTVREVLAEVVKDKIFYETSGGGVTFSGGECMLQIDFLEEILKKCKDEGIHTAIDTAGNVPWESFERVLPYTDMFLYDVKAFTEGLHIEGTGVSNNIILDNLRRLSEDSQAEIVVRIPVIPEFNGNAGELRRIADFLEGIRYRSVELLPYHRMGEHKYDALDMAFTSYPEIDESAMKEYREMMKGVSH